MHVAARTIMKRQTNLLLLLLLSLLPASAQHILTLEECRALALKNNKVLAQSRAARDKAINTRLAGETNYLPKVQALAGYLHMGRELSILNKGQKERLQHIGNDVVTGISEPLRSPEAQAILTQHPDLLPLVQQLEGKLAATGSALNGLGSGIANAFRTDTRNVTAGAILLTQPLYMGGKLRAYDQITHYSERLAELQLAADEAEVVLEVERAYWQVISLANKLRLAQNFHTTLQKLDDDVRKMIQEGVATRANELQVAVKLNEAEMLTTKVENGLTLSRMLLAQLCGMQDSIGTPQFTLHEETLTDITTDTTYVDADAATAFNSRPEVEQLQTAVDIYKAKARIEKAAYLPQLAFIGGIMLSNPHGFDGFRNKFAATWSIGVTLKMPIWSWHEGRYKIRATEAEAQMAAYRVADIREKIELQVAQETFRVNEAVKRLRLTQKNQEQANENLRIANLGYQEGVIVLSDVLQAQTAWLQAQSDKIDAQVDVMLTRAAFRKAMGNQTPRITSDTPPSIVPNFLKKLLR